MLFPWTADSAAYREMGFGCAHNFLDGNFMKCYNGLRPIGVLSYYALPSMVASDPVTITYLTLLLNLACLGILIFSCWTLLTRFVDFGQNGVDRGRNGDVLRRFFIGAFFLVLIVQTIGYLPLRLADIQSLCFLMAGIAIASSGGLTPTKRAAIVGGLVAGCSVLFRQNYVIALAMIVLLWTAYSFRFRSKAAFVSAILFTAGAASCLVQLVWVYLHTGIPWFYEPQALMFYVESTKQPYVELIAYSLPQEGAYAAHLTRPVSEFQFLAVKLFHGLFKFYWTPSLGVAPLGYTAQALDYSDADLMVFQGIAIVVGLLSFASVLLKRPWLSILVITGFVTAVLGAYMSQVEYRYFLFPRLAYIVYAFTALWIVAGRLSTRFSAK